MTRSEAAAALKSLDPHERLEAARVFQLDATGEDLRLLVAAERDEEDVWVKGALQSAIATLSGEGEPQDAPDEEASDSIFDSDLYRSALADATGTLAHELRKRIGYARLAAEDELPGTRDSMTLMRLDELNNVVDAIDRLGKATKSGPLEEFDLSELVRQTSTQAASDLGVAVEFGGPQELMVTSDPNALQMIIENGVRNAAEATLQVGAPEDRDEVPVLVTWGDTDKHYWITILDRGAGPPVGRENAFQKFVTNKPGHHGIGLPLARTAIESIDGRIDLLPRGGSGGAALEVEWPKPTNGE